MEEEEDVDDVDVDVGVGFDVDYCFPSFIRVVIFRRATNVASYRDWHHKHQQITHPISDSV